MLSKTDVDDLWQPPGFWGWPWVELIKDARGRKVTQLNPVRLLRRHDVIEADVRRTIGNESGVRITGRKYAVNIIPTVLVWFTAGPSFNWDVSWTVAGIVVIFLSCVGLKRTRLRKATAAMLKHHHCPLCGYDLRLLPADSVDGATVCPECSCAWRLSAGGAK